MSSITFPSYDPKSSAAKFAQDYIQPMQDVLTQKINAANATEKGLTTLKSAISEFQTSLTSLTGVNKTMLAQSATLSDTSFGSATATAQAAAGTYSFFVEKIATASQVAYNGLSDNGVAGGSVDVKLGGATAFSVSLTGADTNGDGTLSVRELAAAINKSADNSGRVTAAVISIPADPTASPPTTASQQLMLTANETGAANAVTLDVGNMAASGLKTSLADATKFQTVVAAQDAVVWLGDQNTGNRVQQASNTITNISGVKVTFTKAQANGAAPLTVTVARDETQTTKNVQAFIDAFNKLKATVDGLADPGDPENGVAAGPFAHDAGIRAFRDQLVSIMRPDAGLVKYGITQTKGGALALDPLGLGLLNRRLAVDPTTLDATMGSTAGGLHSGVAGKLDTFLHTWANVTTGQIKQRNDAIDKQQKDLGSRQTMLDKQHESTYQRYLQQFTDLQKIQSQMSTNLSMFDALFGSSKSNS